MVETDVNQTHIEELTDAMISRTKQYLTEHRDCGVVEVTAATLEALVYAIMAEPDPKNRRIMADGAKMALSGTLDIALKMEAEVEQQPGTHVH